MRARRLTNAAGGLGAHLARPAVFDTNGRRTRKHRDNIWSLRWRSSHCSTSTLCTLSGYTAGYGVNTTSGDSPNSYPTRGGALLDADEGRCGWGGTGVLQEGAGGPWCQRVSWQAGQAVGGIAGGEDGSAVKAEARGSRARGRSDGGMSGMAAWHEEQRRERDSSGCWRKGRVWSRTR